MKNSKALLHDFVRRITTGDDPEEIQSIAHRVFEHVFSLSRTDIMTGKPVEVPADQEKRLDNILERINRQEPVQYILGEEYFFGRRFTVTNAVLIPRPETEELVHTIIHHPIFSATGFHKILDIGTGSGCIATTLALELPEAKVYATDISPQALTVAAQNAQYLRAPVSFLHHDILTEPLPFADLSVVVSNPPYITEREKESMHLNVLRHEPHLALFVPDNDPLLFYNAIATRAFQVLVSQGLLAVEINEQYAPQVTQAFYTAGFNDVQTIRDLPNKDRIITARKP